MILTFTRRSRFVVHTRLDHSTLTESLQVVFDAENAHRRKSSLVASDYYRPPNGRRPTNCLVHSLIQARKGTYTPGYVPSYEDLAEARKADNQQDRVDNQQDGADKQPDGADQNPFESRLLTKKQVSEMALGIRELAKKLAHIRLKMNVHNIFILTKLHDETLIKNTREVTEWLLIKDKNYKVYESSRI